MLVPTNQIMLKELSKDRNISGHKWSATHRVLTGITERAHCFHDCIYIVPILLLWDLSTLCIVDHLWSQVLIYIYIYAYIYIYIYICICICICILYGNLKFKSHFWNNVSTFVFQCLYTRLKYTLCLDMKMSNKNLFKKTLKKQLYLRFFKDIKTAH